MPNDEWHDRAAELRALAERMSNINTKRTMLSLAEDYDKFSDRAAAGGRPSSLGIAVYSTHKTAKR